MKPTPTNPDSELRNKASQAFLQYHSYVKYIAFESAPTAEVQDDIVNDVFLYFTERADRWDFTRDLQPLLKTITKNIAKQYWRDYLKHLPETFRQIAEYAQLEMEQTSLDDNDSTQEMLAALDLCLAHLTPRSRSLIELHYLNEVSLAQVARETNQNVNTLHSMIFRIRQLLRRCMEKVLSGVS